MEKHWRTLAKTISWRALAMLITGAVVWKVTGRSDLGIGIGIADCLAKILMYYAHERIWANLSFGYVKAPSNSISLLSPPEEGCGIQAGGTLHNPS